ncbi:MAG: FAD-dependent monooxygenase [Ferruginibacter sp.]
MPDSIPQKTQVVIVGAGPTGLSMAAQLLRYHIDFIIIEKNVCTTRLSKAIVVHARTLEIFQEIGLAEKAVTEGRITTAINMLYKGKPKAAINISRLGDGLSAFPFALSLEQSKTEKLLADHITDNEINIHWQCEFIRYEEKDGVTVYYKDADGNEQTITAEYIVGCDGAGSMVRHQMGFLLEGDTIPKLFYLADVILTSDIINKDELFIFLIEKGFVIFFPLKGTGHYRVIGIIPGAAETDQSFTFEDVRNFITDQIQVSLIFNEVNWFATYKVHTRKAARFMKGRCFIAGDAAHIHTPAGGQGMNTGIQDAYNLAWKMAFTIRYKLNGILLESYNSERVGNAKHLLKTTDRMFDIMAGEGRFWNFVRLKIMPLAMRFISRSTMFNKAIFPLLSQIGIAYPESKLTIKSRIGKAKAGDRMPYFIFKDGRNIFDYLDSPVFKMFFFGDTEMNYFQQTGNIVVSPFSFNEIPPAIFGGEKNFYILIRPDNHISYIGKEWSNCKILFQRIS